MKKNIVVISHCILNQNSVVNGLERAKGPFPISKNILEKDISIIQLPCPEFLYLGFNRPPMNYDEYACIKGYRDFCKKLLLPIIEQLKSYIENGYNYLGIIGINESSNCSLTDRQGVYMEEYFKLTKDNKLNNNFMEIPTWYNEDNLGNLLNIFEEFLKRGNFYEKQH